MTALWSALEIGPMKVRHRMMIYDPYAVAWYRKAAGIAAPSRED